MNTLFNTQNKYSFIINYNLCGCDDSKYLNRLPQEQFNLYNMDYGEFHNSIYDFILNNHFDELEKKISKNYYDHINNYDRRNFKDSMIIYLKKNNIVEDDYTLILKNNFEIL